MSPRYRISSTIGVPIPPMTTATAFAPGNISGVFKIIADNNPAKMHSLGLGLTVADGVTATVSKASDDAMVFNGIEIDFPTVATLVRRLCDHGLRIEIESSLPLSSGFGLSGASALATAYATDSLLSLGKSHEELAMDAHIAEVENLTGLGDVCAQYHGGCLVKLVPGAPLDAQRLAVREQPIYFRYFGPISTREVLSDPQRRVTVNRAADVALTELAGLTGRQEVDLGGCIQISKRFAVNSGLLQHDEVKAEIAASEKIGGSASMIMLGDAVFSTVPFEGATKTALALSHARLLH